jgi:hypothetical protein
MPIILPRAALPLIALLAALAPASAFAELGGDVASVLRDSAALGGQHGVTTFVTYDLHESASTDGVRLRQYVDRAGTVFAVSWSGPRSPDVAALLGAHAARYQQALQGRAINHHVATVVEPGLEVSVIRLPRGWRGQALLPTAIPVGVRRSEIR